MHHVDPLDQMSKERGYQQRAQELLDAARAAALAIAKVVRPDTGQVLLGCGFPPEVVRAFAAAAGTESFIRISKNPDGQARAYEWASAHVCGVTIDIQSGRPVTSDDVARLSAQRARLGETAQ
jgi:hypothetical protein